jgi:copper homeostasis protein
MFEYISNIKNQYGISGFVFGASYTNHYLNIDLINAFADHAYPFPITVHKAIDKSPDIMSDVIKLTKIKNVDSILSSGGADCALEGIPNLLKMDALMPKNKYIIAAGSITKDNLQELHNKLQLKAYHGRKIV